MYMYTYICILQIYIYIQRERETPLQLPICQLVSQYITLCQLAQFHYVLFICASQYSYYVSLVSQAQYKLPIQSCQAPDLELSSSRFRVFQLVFFSGGVSFSQTPVFVFPCSPFCVWFCYVLYVSALLCSVVVLLCFISTAFCSVSVFCVFCCYWYHTIPHTILYYNILYYDIL